jgi:hypothetical protein
MPGVAELSVKTLPEPMKCAQCGNPFTPRRRRLDSRFCQGRCRAAWHQAKRTALFTELETTIARAAALLQELRDGGAR